MQGRKKGVKMRLQNMFKKTGERENPVRKAVSYTHLTLPTKLEV